MLIKILKTNIWNISSNISSVLELEFNSFVSLGLDLKSIYDS